MLNSWRPLTQKAYNTYIQKWKQYVKDKDIDVLSPSVVHVCNFLADLFDAGASFSAVNSARSALSAYLPRIDGLTIGNHPEVCRLLKGVFEQRPALPKHSDTWDVGSVLDYLCTLPDTRELTLKQLSSRTALLLSLLTGQRGNALHLLKLDDVRLFSNKCVLWFSDKHKHTKPGVHTEPAEIFEFVQNRKLCLMDHLRVYLEKTEKLRKGRELFISYQKPHAPISRNSFARWVKEMLRQAGVDTDSYSSHSTRSASCSAAAKQGANLSTILKAAGWSSERTFIRFYKRNVKEKSNFAQSVLDSFVKKN